MDLEALRQSVSDMSDEELFEALRAIRLNRRTPTEKPAAKRTATKSAKLKNALSALSEEEIAQLMEVFS